jgi:uncharacterized membrane-anchored protein
MNINIKQTIVLGVGFLIVAAVIFIFGFGGFIQNPGDVSGLIQAMIIGFAGLVTLFFGTDLAHTWGTTASLPPGKFKAVDFWKYIAAICMWIILFGLLLYTQISKRDLTLGTPLASIGGAILGNIGLLLAGIGGNKLVTGIAPTTPANP